jgi:hypothetical protein
MPQFRCSIVGSYRRLDSLTRNFRPGDLALRTSLICFPIFALIAPLAAQEITAPEPRWPVAISAMADAGADTTGEQAMAAQTQDQSPSATASAPIAQPGNADEANTDEKQKHHKFLRACAPGLAVVDDAANVPPMTAGQKFEIFWRQLYNPCRYAGAAFAAGIDQAQDNFPEYGQGMEGYGKRFGVNLADTNLDTFFGRFLLPTLLHDDPRYFRIGPSGTFKRRLLHAILSPEWTRRDNGSHRFNYSKVAGTFMATAVGTAYYPESESDAGSFFARSFSRLGSASGNAAFQEFWPDIKRKLFKKGKQKPAK